jgi:glucan phosphorylase
LLYRDLPQLAGLREAAEDDVFLERWTAVKLAAKRKAARFLEEQTGIKVDPEVMFDVQVRHSWPGASPAASKSASYCICSSLLL